MIANNFRRIALAQGLLPNAPPSPTPRGETREAERLSAPDRGWSSDDVSHNPAAPEWAGRMT